jgi:hypothetical protein
MTGYEPYTETYELVDGEWLIKRVVLTRPATRRRVSVTYNRRYRCATLPRKKLVDRIDVLLAAHGSKSLRGHRWAGATGIEPEKDKPK